MRNGCPINDLAASLHAAAIRDLSPVAYRRLSREDMESHVRGENLPNNAERRPLPHECTVDMFLQTWPSTALGFGGIGGQAITDAYTVVVFGPSGDAAVYFAGQFAYHVPRIDEAFQTDLANRRMVSCRDAPGAYNADKTHRDLWD